MNADTNVEIALGATVLVKLTGQVIARRESLDRPLQYLIEYDFNGKSAREWKRAEGIKEVVGNG